VNLGGNVISALRILRDGRPITTDDVFKLPTYFENMKIVERTGKIRIINTLNGNANFIANFDEENGEISCEHPDQFAFSMMLKFAKFLGGRVVDQGYRTFQSEYDIGIFHPLDKPRMEAMRWQNAKVGLRARAPFVLWILAVAGIFFLKTTDFAILKNVPLISNMLSSVNSAADEQVGTATIAAPVDIYILAADGFAVDRAERLAGQLATDTGLKVKMLGQLGVAEMSPFRDEQFNVWEFIHIANQLVTNHGLDDGRESTIVLTSVDMADPESTDNFRFHTADLDARIAVISDFNLRPDEALPQRLEAKTDDRILKYMKRSIGVTYYKLPRSADPHNFLYSPVIDVSDIDAMEKF
jgi:hypothetical protein